LQCNISQNYNWAKNGAIPCQSSGIVTFADGIETLLGKENLNEIDVTGKYAEIG